MISRLPVLAAIFALGSTGCDQEPTALEIPPSPAEQLAALGKLAAQGHQRIEVQGEIDGGVAKFSADYSPGEKTLVYELKNGDHTERFVVGSGAATYSATGKPDRQVDTDSVMPNRKDWPYATRMAAPFLDAIDGYAATLHSFHIKKAIPPEGVGEEDAEGLNWFILEPNRDNMHDLLLLEVSKAAEIMIGVETETGLLRCLRSKSSKSGEISEIRGRKRP